MSTTVAERFTESSVTLRVTVLLLGLVLSTTIYLIIYRLYLSPIGNIPGPKLAALSFWYEFYYDVIKPGQYTFKIKELHQKYGPIIRVNPYEVHIDDPDFYDQVYVSAATRPTDKWSWTANMFQTGDASISTIPHLLHHRRRAMYSKHFSTTSVHNLEPVIRGKVDRLMQRLDQAGQAQQPVSLTHAYSALTMDIITAYCFARSNDTLELPDFARVYNETFKKSTMTSHFQKQFPWVTQVLTYLPASILQRMYGDLSLVVAMQQTFVHQVVDVVERKSITKPKDLATDDVDVHVGKTVFDSMLEANVPASEKSTERLAREAQLLVIAGTLTTSHTLMTITYHLLTNPTHMTRLRNELLEAEANVDGGAQIPLNTLEHLPFLNAVVREGLRMSYGVPHRLQRVSPNAPLVYSGFTLPPGTPVSMSAMLMHDNESIFPNHERFNPDRWLPYDTVGTRLNKYLVPFSKGSRQCVGMNLAWAEIHITLAVMFGSGGKGMQLYDTTFERDVKTTIDGFNPLTVDGSQGLRVVIEV